MHVIMSIGALFKTVAVAALVAILLVLLVMDSGSAPPTDTGQTAPVSTCTSR